MTVRVDAITLFDTAPDVALNVVALVNVKCDELIYLKGLRLIEQRDGPHVLFPPLGATTMRGKSAIAFNGRTPEFLDLANEVAALVAEMRQTGTRYQQLPGYDD